MSTERFYTDGQGVGFYGGPDWGPVPYYDWRDECQIIEVDPPHYVWVTAHFDFGDDGVVDDYIVFPYEYDEAGVVSVDVESIVAGESGSWWATWNIGLDSTPRKVPFDCRPEEPTDTTTTTTTTTVAVEVTTTTSTTSPTPDTVTVPEGPVDRPDAPLVLLGAPEPPAELPETGFGAVEGAMVGAALLFVGAAIVARWRRRRGW